MPAFTKTLTYALATAAASTGISAAASGTAGTSLLITGSLASGGVATLDTGTLTARRVIITSAGNDSSNTFVITGTDRYGRAQTETLAGTNGGVAQSLKDFRTVTSIVPASNSAGNVSAGTNGVGSSAPMIVDWLPNGNLLGAQLSVSGTVNYSIEVSLWDLAPAWDLATNTPGWSTNPNFTNQTIGGQNQLSGPFTMLRILINSGTGTVTGKFITPFIGGHL